MPLQDDREEATAVGAVGAGLVAAAVFALAFAVYANSLRNGFVWDDPIILSRQLPVFRNLGDVLLPPQNIPQFAPDYYRPLVIATYLVDRALGGGAPLWFHLTVVLAHALTTLAVFVFGRMLFRLAGDLAAAEHSAVDAPTVAAATAAALFAVHPVHTEAVAWIAGRGDVLAGLFGVAAATAYLASRRRREMGLAAALATLMALWAKEAAVALLILLPLLDVLVPEPARGEDVSRHSRRRAEARNRGGARALRLMPVLIAVGLYFALRLSAIGLSWHAGDSSIAPSPARLLAALGFYLRRLLFPWPLNAYVSELPRAPVDLALAAVLLLAVVLGLGLALRRGKGGIAFALAWMLAGIAPALTILVKIPDAPVAERYAYLPSVGFCLLCGAVVTWASARTRARVGIAITVCLVVLVFGIATARRNRVWESDLLLWGDTVTKSTHAGLPFRSLAVALAKEGHTDEALKLYELALQKRNDARGLITIYNNLGTIALERGDLATAEKHYRRTLEIAATPDCLFNLGVIALTRAQQAKESGRADLARRESLEALPLLEQAESLSPHDPDIQAAFGQALLFLDRSDEARSRFQKALEMGVNEASAMRIRALLE